MHVLSTSHPAALTKHRFEDKITQIWEHWPPTQGPSELWRQALSTAHTQGHPLGTYYVQGHGAKGQAGLTHDRPVLAPGPRGDLPGQFLSH